MHEENLWAGCLRTCKRCGKAYRAFPQIIYSADHQPGPAALYHNAAIGEKPDSRLGNSALYHLDAWAVIMIPSHGKHATARLELS